jgi:ABC-type antimicrobial peptide transport system permease subunit
LAGLGLFGITAYPVSRRRREIGIRMTLGAAPGSVIRLVFGRVCLMIAAGVVVGAAVSMWTTQFTASLFLVLNRAIRSGWLLPASHLDPSVAVRLE